MTISGAVLETAEITLDITDRNSGQGLTMSFPATTVLGALQTDDMTLRDKACGIICGEFGREMRRIFGIDTQLLTWSDIGASIVADLSVRQLQFDLGMSPEHPSLFD